MTDNPKRIAVLRTFVAAWEVFAASIPEEYGEQVWHQMKNTVQLARSELNCRKDLQKRDF